MSRLAQNARVMDAVLADLAPFKPVSAPVDVTDADAFPEIARATASLAAMSPARRAELEREWDA
jgi:hypothetical protein